MTSPFTVYVKNDETRRMMQESTDKAAELLSFGSRNQFLLWLMTQSAEDIAEALRPLRAKALQREVKKFQ